MKIPMSEKHRVNFFLSEKLYSRLEAQSVFYGIPVSQLIQSVIMEHFRKIDAETNGELDA